MILHTTQTSNRKPQNTPQRQADAAAWTKVLQKYESKSTVKRVVTPAKKTAPYRRETTHYPSLDTGSGVATLAAVPEYTGSEMIGIGQMHKSNAVPVFRHSDAESLAKMRR